MRQFNVSRASISRILQKEKRKLEGEAELAPKKKVGRKSILTGEMLVFLLNQLDHNSQLTLKDLSKLIGERYNVEASSSVIYKALTDMKVSWKNVTPIPLSWNNEETIKARMMFVASLGTNFYRPIFYIDEKGFNLHTRKSKDGAAQGNPAILTLLPKGKRLNVIAAFGKSGFVHYRLVESVTDKKGINAEDLRNFTIDLVSKIPKDSVLVLNSATFHEGNVEPIWEIIKILHLGIDKIYLPPYSPFLNPIEYAFNTLVTAVEGEEFWNRGDLKRIVEEKLKTAITAEVAEGFYQKAGKYYHMCRLGIPFTGKSLDPDQIMDISLE